MTNKTGVQEWANHSINLQYTCEYGCIYCYARKLNNRFKFTPKEPVIKHYNGVVMFPTMHDITISNFNKVADTIEKLLKVNNKILVVSKMDLYIAQKFIEKFKDNPKKINLEFRITITCFNNEIKKYWEPKSSMPSGYYLSLMALEKYFKTSVSIEPLLDLDIIHFVFINKTFISCPSSDIWIGCLTNYKLNPNIPEEKAVIELYKTLPEIYEEYKQYDFIKFKDSFFKAMNRELKRREKRKTND